MSLIDMRNNTKPAAKTGLAAMRSNQQSNKPQSKQQMRPDVPDPETARYELLQREFDQLPMVFGQKTQLGTAAKDLIRMGTKGLSYGALDQLIGDEQETKDAALRSGWAGTAAELGGAVFSPVTRGVGMAASLARPAGKGIMKALTNLGITGAEGGALAGIDSLINGGDVQNDAETGAALATGAEATLKHALPKSAGLLSMILSKVPMNDLSNIFEIASKSELGADAIKQLQKNKAPVKLLETIDKTRGKLDGMPVLKADGTSGIDDIEEALVDVFSKTTTSGGHKALDAQDQLYINRLFDKAYNSKIDATTFNRNSLDDLIGYLEETKVPAAAEKSAGGMHVKNVHDTIKRVGSETSPMFRKVMDMLDMKKKAYTAGKATSTMAPNTRAFDTARDVGLATAFLAGSAALTNPVLLAAAPLMLTAASPRAVGAIARRAGSTKRALKKTVPKNTGYGTLGLLPGMSEEDRR